MSSQYVVGLNAAREALSAEVPVEKVWVRNRPGKRHHEIMDLARRRRVPCVQCPERELSRLGGDGHQGVVVLMSPAASRDLRDLEGGPGRLFLALDGVTDPMNLGAILRSAEGAGVAAAILPKRRTAPISPVVMKASAGAAAHVPVVKVSSLADALLRLSDRGFFVLGLDMGGDSLYDVASDPEIQRSGLVVVVGAEGRGLGQLVRRRCHRLASIPLAGRLESLNASVASAIALFELRRVFGSRSES